MKSKATPASAAGYSSDRMKMRRQTVLAAARRLIADHGMDGFSMKMLAKYAGVSAATLFNIYSTRENLISQAVLDAFHSSLDDVTLTPRTIGEVEHYVEWTAGRVVALGKYMDAVVASYFSRMAGNSIRAVLKHEAAAPYAAYLESAQTRGNLIECFDVTTTAELIANQIFAIIHAWSMGEVTDKALASALKRGVFTIVMAAMRGRDLKKARSIVDEIAG